MTRSRASSRPSRPGRRPATATPRRRWRCSTASVSAAAASRPCRRGRTAAKGVRDMPAQGSSRRMSSPSTDRVSQLPLRDDTTIPQLGFGVFLVPQEETAEVVGRALDAGYRHIDTAAAYRNEAGVGEAVRSSGLPREEVYITTKCFNTNHGRDEARAALERSLGRLEMEQVDLYLIHWPVPMRDRYVETWEAIVQAQSEGLVKSIGVSNFKAPHLERIIEATG